VNFSHFFPLKMAKEFKTRNLWENIKFLFYINSWGQWNPLLYTDWSHIHTCTYIHTHIHGSKVINFCIELCTSFEHIEKQRQTPTFHQSQRQASKQASKQRRKGALGQVGLVAPYLLVVVVVVWMIFYGLYSLHSTLFSSLLSLPLSFSTNPFLLLHCIPIFFL
jgi:hypothetical protein